jgi:hypothetical protein
MDTGCVGIIRVPLTTLSFVPTPGLDPTNSWTRQAPERLLRLKLASIHKLARTFRLGRCTPSRPEHQMHGVVTPDTLDTILRLSHLSKDALFESSARGHFPFVKGGFSIWCRSGYRRAIAARLTFRESAWWTVRLYCSSGGTQYVGRHY